MLRVRVAVPNAFGVAARVAYYANNVASGPAIIFTTARVCCAEDKGKCTTRLIHIYNINEFTAIRRRRSTARNARACSRTEHTLYNRSNIAHIYTWGLLLDRCTDFPSARSESVTRTY